MSEGTSQETKGANGATVFISYASQDAAVANAVVGTLERAGIAQRPASQRGQCVTRKVTQRENGVTRWTSARLPTLAKK
jgi:hypothetical protein